MGEVWRWRGRRLRGLDELATPPFVGRMNRVQRRRKLVWRILLLGACLIGGALGWQLS